MSELSFSIDWVASGSPDPVSRDTSAQLAIHLSDICLTRNEDVWSKTMRDSIYVSVYPLVLWLAGSWWRLNHEPLPATGIRPALSWRMAHELGAAHHGYVWPRILFVPDGESMNLWYEPISTPGQSVNYTSVPDVPRSISLAEFQHKTDAFIDEVISRLHATGQSQTELDSLWTLIKEDRNNPECTGIRKLEAQMGFDPEECPQSIIEEALRLQKSTGQAAMSELAPVFGENVRKISSLGEASGLQGRPQEYFCDRASFRLGQPWEQGMAAAKLLRKKMGLGHERVQDKILLELLGVTESQLSRWSPSENISVAVAKPGPSGSWDMIFRKRHPLSQRFEWARFLGDILSRPIPEEGWLVSSDLTTARQKRQRSFAAEFLCPIDALVAFLDEDYSESAQESAAENFQVSEKTVETLLTNHGYIDRVETPLPYRLVAKGKNT